MNKPSKITHKYMLEDQETFHCLMLAACGFSDKYIQKQIKLSPAQVYLRCRRAGIKRKDYRDGKNPIAQHITHQGAKFVDGTVRKVLLQG